MVWLTLYLESGNYGFVISSSFLIKQKYSAALALPYADQKPVFESSTPTKLIAPLSQGLSDSRRTKLTTERQQENYEFLSSCIKEDLGFKDSKPVAACVIYKCLVHWHAFEFERTTIFYYITLSIP
ncbi:Protein OPAQUE1 [Camellia lanceoleosa]|uniref:Protein OPAQUE1 n=1 Tax=Camellia lanceoleosa TaxID=1840588 RepID=A0ACC0GHH4_9ERIC|nr:Protein OPAQUE1 [Camellia lanceoleosa]